jgi:uncharacterized membrane protein
MTVTIKPDRMTRTSQAIMRWMGTKSSVYIHSLALILCPVLILFVSWDKIFLFLTFVVSIEAIYQNIFLQMGSNLNSDKLVDIHEDVQEVADELDKDE